jgi:S-adenosylmethionine:tRNA ribosyltransferase-isomerase
MNLTMKLETVRNDSIECVLSRIRDFVLPAELEASEPPEARGLARDQVRLMVSGYPDDTIEHVNFFDLPNYLEPGDTLVINTSGTINAAVNALNQDGLPFELHISTIFPGGQAIVELRQIDGHNNTPYFYAQPGERFQIPAGGSIHLLKPYNRIQSETKMGKSPAVRLWIAQIDLSMAVDPYLNQHGFPIRYSYVPQKWPLPYYQTIFATQMGSAEMPSAGRAFTHQLITRLVTKGIWITPVLLHTGVSSLENHERPPEEFFNVSPETANLVNTAREMGRRVVAVGTTVLRALESVSAPNGTIHAGKGWTDVIITPQRGLYTVNALLTGFHEPQSSHLDILTALTGEEHITKAYQQALDNAYLWHEFGDMHLIIPQSKNLT